ncbi:MAG: hypothetical protein OXG24_05630 [Gammaproteobacteria bacterium]|nr:hypothetical protein [Gammaproteobacteria bacterium]
MTAEIRSQPTQEEVVPQGDDVYSGSAPRKSNLQTSSRRQVLASRYWPLWFLLGICWLATWLPMRTQHWLGRMVAKAMFRIAPRRKRIIEKNIDLAFPELKDAEREELVRDTIASFGMTVTDTLFVWMRGIEPLVDRVKISGVEHLLKDSGDDSRGTVILGAHFASLDLVAAALSRKCAFGATYRPAHNPVIDLVCRRSRRRYYDQMLEATQLRLLAHSLRNGKAVWFAADQDMGSRKSTCFVPFFGVDASTVVTPFRLARKTGARVLFMSHRRNEENLTWELLLTPVELAADSDPQCFAKDASNINKLIEDAVRTAPSQYFWVHRRFKTLANGDRRDYKTV